MTVSDEALFQAVLHEDFYAFMQAALHVAFPGENFVMGWYLEAIAYQLSKCANGKRKRLLVNLPPRSLKSIAISVLYVAWLLGRDPSIRIMCVSHSDDLAGKHARDCRRLMQSDFYLSLFPHTRLNPAKNKEMEFETTRGGYRLSLSIRGGATGRGCDMMIIDDPIKADDVRSDAERQHVKELYDNTLYSRLNNKETGVIIAVMQRLHEDDVSAYLLTKGYDQLCLPSYTQKDQKVYLGPNRPYLWRAGTPLNPKHESMAVIDQHRSQIPLPVWSAQYMQAPIPAGGLTFQLDMLRTRYRQDDIPRDIVLSCDLATKPGQSNDYSVIAVAAVENDKAYLLDIIRIKEDYPRLKTRIENLVRHYKPRHVLVEDTSLGSPLLQELGAGNSRYVAIKPKLGKEERAIDATASLVAGNLLLPSDAPWLTDFTKEMLAFPNGRYDDQVDAVVQLLLWMKTIPKPVEFGHISFLVPKGYVPETFDDEGGEGFSFIVY